MKHFIIMINYTVDLERIDEILPEHRKFLQAGYDKGLLLFSGPRNPRTGGIVAARGDSMDEIQSFFSEDPYRKNNCADYEFIEYNPVKFQNVLENWIDSE